MHSATIINTKNTITNWSNWISPSGATKLCTMNLCLFFSFGSKLNGCKQTVCFFGERNKLKNVMSRQWLVKYNVLAMSIISFGFRVPQLGRTQYFFGAVVLILNKIVLSVGFRKFINDVMDWLNGPVKFRELLRFCLHAGMDRWISHLMYECYM